MNGRCPFRFRVLAIAAACATFSLPPGASAATEAEAAAVSASPASATNRVWNRAQDLAIFALGLIGVDYRFGGNTPEAGLDCSGLVGYVFQQVTGITLPRTSQELSRMGRRVTVEDLKVGDLVFFNTRSLPFSHVGIYLGDDRFVHAPSHGGEVEIVSLSAKYWHARFSGARRLAAVSTETRSQDTRAAGNALPRLPSTATSLPPLMETLADTAN
ncbi:MAG: NlpC/P60 family protein [Betaproteobacteria bacterium]|nr:MAG: NlpC/P60 family protein [Betaproteobacteria bacterium]